MVIFGQCLERAAISELKSCCSEKILSLLVEGKIIPQGEGKFFMH